MSRSETLAKLRTALRGRTAPGLPERIPELPHFEDPAAVFSQHLSETGGIVLDSRQMSLEECLSKVLTKAGTTSIVWEERETLETHSIPFTIRGLEAFEEQTLVFSNHPEARVSFPLRLATSELTVDRIERATLSAGSAEVAIAETGTVLFRSGRRRSRLLFGLAPCRLTLVSRRAIVHNLAQAVDAGLRLEESSLLTWATGPSRTADIEKRLVVGVHGPSSWFVILTD